MPSYRGYRFPPDIISHAVWVCHRFSLSFRDVEDLLAERGITVTYETIRQWCATFGLEYARRLRSRRGRQGDTWHLDEVFVQLRRNRRAAIPLFPQVVERTGLCPSTTDHRQAAQLWSRLPHGDAVGRPSHGPVRQQPSRGLARTDATTRTADARLQVGGAPPALRVRPRRGAESLPSGPSSAAVGALPAAPNAGIHGMGCGDVCPLTARRRPLPRGEKHARLPKLTVPN